MRTYRSASRRYVFRFLTGRAQACGPTVAPIPA
jgi:hypothetical protein